MPRPSFNNSARVDQLIRGGKLTLSLDDAIALALENNLDLAIARYNLNIADTDILRAKGGGTVRGVATGVVQGTPGGGVGSIGATSTGGGAGGTTTAAGGAAAGTGGIVSSTLGAGPNIPSFDPFLNGTLSLDRTAQPSASPFSGAPVVLQNSGTANFTYNQGFVTGSSLQVGFQNTRSTTNSFFSSLSPQITSGFKAMFTQRLLTGFGVGPNVRFIRIAKNDREISDVAFRQQVISTVSQIQNIYWDLVNAYEDMKVRERSVALANRLLSDTRKQVEIGTQAPIEIVRAQSEVATRNQELIVSQTNLQLQQLLIKNAITRNMSDPALASAEVIPTDTMQLPAVEPVVPTDDLIADALSHRPELAQSRIDLVNRDITKKAARNALLPSLDLFAYYGASSLGGVQNGLATCSSSNNTSFCTAPGSIPTQGYSDVFGNLFNSSAPNKGIGLQLIIPIRNRSAQADQIRSELEYRQAEARLQQLQNQIRIEVRNAQFSVQQNRARVEAAKAGVALGNQTLDAEQKKYALGASTNYNVLQAQRDLALSESNMVAATTAYEKSRVELDRVMGLTLDKLGIQVADAETGNVNTMPKVPYVVPRPETPQMDPNQPQMPPPPQPLPAEQQPPAVPQAPPN